MTETCLAEHEIERLFLRMSEGRELVATRSALGMVLLHAESCFRCRSLAEEFAADYEQTDLLPGRTEDEIAPLYAMAADTGVAEPNADQPLTLVSDDGLVRCILRRNPLNDGAYGVLLDVAAGEESPLSPEVCRRYVLSIGDDLYPFDAHGRLELPTMPGQNPAPRLNSR